MKKLIIILTIISNSFLLSQSEPLEMPDGYYSNFTLKVAYFLGTLDLIEKMPPVPESLVEQKDIVYKEIDTIQLKLDIYRKKELTQKRPLIIFIHGGAWKGGDKKDYRRYLVDFAEKGYITATIQYRLTKVAKFPAAVNDVKCAVKWLKANADNYLIDVNKIAIVGGSAGGHLAMMIGYSSDTEKFNECNVENSDTKVNAIVNLYGPTDLTTDYAKNHPSVINFIGKSYNEDPNIFKAASPLFYITKDDTPTLIFQGTLDELVPYSQSDSLKSRLDKIGVPAEYHKLEGWPHTMDLSVEVNKYCQYYMDRFFNKYIPIENK